MIVDGATWHKILTPVEFDKFPKIRSWHSLRKEHGTAIPTAFVGAVKIHGTNAGIRILVDGQRERVIAQSRNRLVEDTASTSHFGFPAWVEKHRGEIVAWARSKMAADKFFITVWGEWFGPGIQKGVAVAKLSEKKFMPFVYRVWPARKFGGDWQAMIVHPGYPELMAGMAEGLDLFEPGIPLVTLQSPGQTNIQDPFGKIHYSVFSPQDEFELMENITDLIDKQCPMGERYGIEGVGEGIVWYPYHVPGLDYLFKTKGSSHQKAVPRDKKPQRLSEAQSQEVEHYLDKALTYERLRQGIDHLTEMLMPRDFSSIPEYLSWLVLDATEELRLFEIEDPKVLRMVKKRIGSEGVKWFKDHLKGLHEEGEG